MKKLLVAAISLALLALACKKSGSSSSSYYFTASMNDTAKTFNVNAMAMMDTLSGIVSLSLIGNVSSAANFEGMNLTINNSPSNKPIVAGTYTENSTDFAVAGVYNPGSTTIVYGAGEFPSPPNPLTIVITSIDKSSVKGTFSGDFYYTNTAVVGPVGPGKKTFTKGQFYLKIQKF
ncbi:MAG TPA: hypothetical protein VKQ52_16160 [Puia sp.]|nr:hypothetical protein [Puia sp.]